MARGGAAFLMEEGTSMLTHQGSPKRCLVSILVTFLVPMIAIGCGEDDGIGRRYPVSGTIKYHGQPVPKATVTFTPADAGAGRPAAGGTDENGSYRLGTASSDDGALPGKYTVSISAVEIDLSKTKNVPGGMYRSDIILKAPKKSMVPAKYSSTKTSTLSAEVKPDRNTFDFALED
jgi:hypothetical protein